MDEELFHPGLERVYGELWRRYWILKGRRAVRKHQFQCHECRKWHAAPEIPRRADLPPACLQLYKPPFWSTEVDWFGPFTIKLGRRVDKWWRIIFKCMTTRFVPIDLLESLDTDAFLMALCHYVSHRGKLFEILADQGANFRGGVSKLQRVL